MKKLMKPYRELMTHFEVDEKRIRSYGSLIFERTKERWLDTPQDKLINKVVTFNHTVKEDRDLLDTVLKSLKKGDYSCAESVDTALCSRYAAKLFINYVKKVNPELVHEFITI